MNTALQTHEIPHHPTPVKMRSSVKRVTNELKTKARNTTAKKKILLTAKNSTPKRNAARKVRASAKRAPRKMKPGVIKDNPAGRIALVPERPLHAPDLPIEEDQPPTSHAAEQTSLSTTDVAFEPASFEDQPEPESVMAAEIIPAPEFEPFQESNLPAETVALSLDNAPALEDAISQVEKQSPLTPLASFWKSMVSQLAGLWNWTFEKFKSHQVKKRLRVCETVSLGEKRFLAVVQVDGEQFLVGGSSSSVSTLAHLERSRDFSDVFQRHCGQDFSQA